MKGTWKDLTEFGWQAKQVNVMKVFTFLLEESCRYANSFCAQK